MQDRPGAAELLDALAAQLVNEVREWVPRERRFQILVAANVCAVVAREIRAGAEPSQADLVLFRRLLGEPAGEVSSETAPEDARAVAAELANAIRAGELDADLDSVADALRSHVRRKLDVARPGYAD